MTVRLDLSGLRAADWPQYLLRFALGGLMTVIAGLLAKLFGPVFGGVFLAFPVIFPASATLIARHEQRKKAQRGMVGGRRGRQAAALDAAGAVPGAVGLACFAAWVWAMLPRAGAATALIVGAPLWLLLSVALWLARKRKWLRQGRVDPMQPR